MLGWLSKKMNPAAEANWRLRKAERFAGETVRCALGEIIDVSATGLRVRCAGKPPIKPGGVLPLRLQFGDGSMQLQAQVRWCKRRGLKRHEIGLQFVNLKPGMLKVLDAIARFGMASAAKHLPDPPTPEPQADDTQQGQEPRKPHVLVDLPNYFHVLGLTSQATDADIKSRYRKLAVTCHPDRSSEPDAMQKFEAISEAYHVLSDPQRREAYVRLVG